jgi:hypothetical protein
MILIIPSNISMKVDDNHYLDLTCQIVFDVRNLLVHCDYYSQHFFFWQIFMMCAHPRRHWMTGRNHVKGDIAIDKVNQVEKPY